jgi:hypothetical protein
MGNRAWEAGGLRFCFFYGPAEPLISHNIISANVADEQGGGVTCDNADPNLEHTTIDGNHAATAGGGVYCGEGHIGLVNSIVSNSTMGGGLYCAAGTITTSHCDVWNNTGGNYINCSPSSTDIECDPQYCDPPLDLRLFDISCCLGAGSGGTDIGALGIGCFANGVGDHLPGMIAADRFMSVVPNPFNPVTRIRFVTARAGVVGLEIFDLRGGLVRSLVSRPLPVGAHAYLWEGVNSGGHPVASGTYFVRLRIGAEVIQTEKITLVR